MAMAGSLGAGSPPPDLAAGVGVEGTAAEPEAWGAAGGAGVAAGGWAGVAGTALGAAAAGLGLGCRTRVSRAAGRARIVDVASHLVHHADNETLLLNLVGLDSLLILQDLA
jgi:hypothetical protein